MSTGESTRRIFDARSEATQTQGHLISQNLPNKRAAFLMYFDYILL